MKSFITHAKSFTDPVESSPIRSLHSDLVLFVVLQVTLLNVFAVLVSANSSGIPYIIMGIPGSISSLVVLFNNVSVVIKNCQPAPRPTVLSLIILPLLFTSLWYYLLP